MPGISEGFPGPPLWARFHKTSAGFLFVPWFVVRTICSLPSAKWELAALWGAAGSPRSTGVKCTGPRGDWAQPSRTWLWHWEPLLSANFCHSSALARYWLWSIRLFLYSFFLQNRYRNSLQPVRLLWDIFRNAISDPNSPFPYPQRNSIEIVSGLSLCSKIIWLIISEKHFVKINRNLNIFSENCILLGYGER